MARERLAIALLVLALAARASADSALPETQTPLRLIGTVVAASAERSIAVVDNQGATQVVRPGDVVGAARVREIHQHGIVLEQSGRLVRLALAPVAIARAPGGAGGSGAGSGAGRDASSPDGVDSPNGSGRGSRETASSRRGRTSPRVRAKPASAVPASAARDQDDEADSEATQRVGNDQLLVNLSQQARYKPLLGDDGQLRGVAILDVRPDSALERIGLRSGDVVVSVAGVPVDNTSQAFNALRALNPRAGGEVLVERGGLPTRITVPPGAL